MQQLISKEDISTYLKAIGLPVDIKLSVSAETLCLLANKQMIYNYYQNVELHLKQMKPISLEFVDILQRVCVNRKGGLCYEHEFLLYYILKHLGFQVEIIRCQVREVGSPYNPDLSSTHAFLYVQLGDETFLLDPGFGTRSYRFPIKVNFQNLAQTFELFAQEHYRIQENEKHYEFQHHMDGNWVTYYDFEKPLKFCTVQDIHHDYLNLFTSKEFLGIRDSKFVVCKNTEYGRIQYLWFRQEKLFTAFKKVLKFNEVSKIEFKSYDEFKEDVKKEVEFELPDYELLR
ncbi:unnamed protein product (macronuclear) [Paramecium tetraurelia]|uniref:Arylamine N-acetyltransferase 1 n=1 Tax=Paramecium tetraurelia TaxID=5888 RepID=A0EA51_PARTE|nr:uncharacterized protein GSPATT00024900001 [Paramecium tetraurelia]CAK92168.1 unnamed protein product [Paramecium tetraurelia]CBL43370.1 TPA: arylamine N-acetyltransferase 1 [Paramecium tetraurelia]|eukprot:XP_001459565.1 hypothetical protein (macronuclear) [Paramecium tetraurelia strain d4-2]